MSDDLDAFFSDVAAAEASVKPSDETFEEEDDNHRTKKRKLDNTPVIQTISSVSAKPMKAAETLVKKVEQQQPSYPAPPPPQPVYQQSYVHPSVAPYHQRQAPVPKPPPKPVAPKVEKQTNAAVRSAAGKTWIDHSLEDWPANDIRLFVGDIAKEVNESMLLNAFKEYKSCAKVKIIYDKRTGASKGFGFVSFLDAKDAANCLRQMNDKFIGGRPIKVKKSEWKDRDMKEVKKKNKRDDKRKKEWI